MPSYFRSDDDVRIFFLKELDTPQKKKKYARLKTFFVQSVRRPGTRGHFFFHRKCATLGGAPILIFEPQGPIDHGIFQGGITRFGETLFGTFRCTAPGYLELEVKKNISEANSLKFGRDMRRVIKRIAGIMQTGGDDRIRIVTPREKARVAREAAEKKRREAEALRERRRQLAEERRLKRELKRQQKEQKRQKNEQLKAARQQKKELKLSEQVAAEKARLEAAAQQSAPPKSPRTKAEAARQLRREKEERAAMARIERLQQEALAAEADGESVEADAAAEDARDLAGELVEHLRAAREPYTAVARACEGKNKVQVQAALFQMIARSPHKAAAQRLLSRVRSAAPDQLDGTIAQWVSQEEGRLSEINEAVDAARAEALSLEKLASRSGATAVVARESAAQLKVEELQARLTAAEAASGAEDATLADLRGAIAEAEDARRDAQIAARQQDVSRSLRSIQAGFDRMEEARDPVLDDPKKLRRRMRQDPSMRKALKRLRGAIAALRASGARRRSLTEVWSEHPDILWAQATILSAL